MFKVQSSKFKKSYGLMVLRSYGLTVLRSYGLTVLRSYGLMVLRSYGLMVLWSLLTVLLLNFGCTKYKGPLPKVYVHFEIIPDDINVGLYNIGSHAYVTGGINGIVIYRFSSDVFMAFDRACPHDWSSEEEPRVWVEDNGITLKCEGCGSEYNILDGGKSKGPSKYPLKQYFTSYDGVILRVRS